MVKIFLHLNKFPPWLLYCLQDENPSSSQLSLESSSPGMPLKTWLHSTVISKLSKKNCSVPSLEQNQVACYKIHNILLGRNEQHSWAGGGVRGDRGWGGIGGGGVGGKLAFYLMQFPKWTLRKLRLALGNSLPSTRLTVSYHSVEFFNQTFVSMMIFNHFLPLMSLPRVNRCMCLLQDFLLALQS